MNLSRAWRSKNFDEIVGQELVVRILKNTIYRDSLFPAYLFAGQHGCGKTSMGRIFAGALNCEQRSVFIKNPQQVILPCGNCASCNAMRLGSHPDFIEIDAASHTGVDTIRELIEMASFLPVLGKHKIYLIDEAHMLTKASFNALLKILEEPASHVVFLLATTEEVKIIDTVRSRCLQLLFNSIKPEIITEHLKRVCASCQFHYEQPALELIAHEARGSLRDALNILERVTSAYSTITYDHARSLLGIPEHKVLLALLEAVAQGSCHTALEQMTKHDFAASNGTILWKKWVELVRMVMRMKIGITPSVPPTDDLTRIMNLVTVERTIQWLEWCYEYEIHRPKTVAWYELFELCILKMTSQTSVKNKPNNMSNELQKLGFTPSQPKNDPRQAPSLSEQAKMLLEYFPGTLHHE